MVGKAKEEAACDAAATNFLSHPKPRARTHIKVWCMNEKLKCYKNVEKPVPGGGGGGNPV